MTKERGQTMKIGIRKLSKLQILAILFFLGLILGVIAANFLRGYYLTEIQRLDYTYYSILSTKKIDYTGLLQYTLLHNIKEFAVFWILCITILGVPFIIFSIIKKGFEIGFLISSVTVLYGSKGILLFFSYIMPQALIYVPVMFVCLQKGYQLAKLTIYRNKCYTESNKSMIINNLAVIIILLSLLGIGALLETYFGTVLFKRALELCV